MSGVGAVVIGRNEGERLRACLESVLQQVPSEAVLYVDSGSIDRSPEVARQMGIEVLQLDPSKPFSAARARNEGFELLISRLPSLQLIQFIDGDCEVCEGWIERSQQELLNCDRCAIVCGILREREPRRSIYNRLCALEWLGDVGEIAWCGGIFMVRVEVFESAGGFRDDMIAGEEPEFCARLRAAGWSIRRVGFDMATHDAAMLRFGQWWKRASRAGYGWADRASRCPRPDDPAATRKIAAILVWGFGLPLVALAAALPTQGLSLLLLLAYPLQWARVVLAQRRRGLSAQDASLYSSFTLLDKFANLHGLARFLWNRLFDRPAQLIEHKQARVSVRGMP